LLSDTTIRQPAELIPGLLHLGTKAMLAGASKSSKTQILMNLAASVATGTPFLQWDCRQGKVLYLNYELDAAFFRDRLEQIQQSRGEMALTNLHVMNLRGTQDSFDGVIQKVLESAHREGYALVIIDPVYKATGSKSDSSGQVVTQLCAKFDKITKACGAAVVFAHHFNKGNAGRQAAIDRMAGSGVWARDLDTIVTLTAHGVLPDHYVVETSARNFQPFPPFVIRRSGTDIEVREEVQAPGSDSGNEPDDRGLLSMLGTEHLTRREWRARAEQHGLHTSTIYRVVDRLVRQNLVVLDPITQRFSRPAAPVISDGPMPESRPERDGTERNTDWFVENPFTSGSSPEQGENNENPENPENPEGIAKPGKEGEAPKPTPPPSTN
jgi:hypothetical protein